MVNDRAVLVRCIDSSVVVAHQSSPCLLAYRTTLSPVVVVPGFSLPRLNSSGCTPTAVEVFSTHWGFGLRAKDSIHIGDAIVSVPSALVIDNALAMSAQSAVASALSAAFADMRTTHLYPLQHGNFSGFVVCTFASRTLRCLYRLLSLLLRTVRLFV